MKYLNLTARRLLLALVAALVISTQVGLHADSSDELRPTFERAPMREIIRLMSEEKVARVLEDHLDPFPRSQARPLAGHLLELCRKHRFDPAFVLSLIQVESNFRVSAVSPSGAVGLMQLMPATAAELAVRKKVPYSGVRSLHDPFTNLTLGMAYLAYLRDRYTGASTYSLVAAYNLGPAKFDSLRSKKSFKPSKTKAYFNKIQKGVVTWRYYVRPAVAVRLGKKRA